jgi:hypothetical protein
MIWLDKFQLGPIGLIIESDCDSIVCIYDPIGLQPIGENRKR